jgi:SRSO17 transposase
MQPLVASAAWDVEGVRDDLRAYIVETLGTMDRVLIVDETGFLKKGTKSAGVQRQYSGTAGCIENCQIGVFLAYATARGHAFVDRELYVPESWHANRPRCREAGIPDTLMFRTKPQLAQGMLARALAAGLRPAWVLGDTLYGNDRALRTWLETQQQAFLLALRSDSTSGCGSMARRGNGKSAPWRTRSPPPRACGAVRERAAKAPGPTTGRRCRSRESGPPDITPCWCASI